MTSLLIGSLYSTSFSYYSYLYTEVVLNWSCNDALSIKSKIELFFFSSVVVVYLSATGDDV